MWSFVPSLPCRGRPLYRQEETEKIISSVTMLESNIIAVKPYLIFPCKSFCVYGIHETSVSTQNQEEHFHKYWVVQDTTQSCCWEQHKITWEISMFPTICQPLSLICGKSCGNTMKKISMQVFEVEQGLRMSWADTASTEHVYGLSGPDIPPESPEIQKLHHNVKSGHQNMPCPTSNPHCKDFSSWLFACKTTQRFHLVNSVFQVTLKVLMCNIGNNPVHPKRQESAQFPQPAAVPSVSSHFKSNLLNGNIDTQVKLPALSSY